MLTADPDRWAPCGASEPTAKGAAVLVRAGSVVVRRPVQLPDTRGGQFGEWDRPLALGLRKHSLEAEL
jgi:hypothetical protein